MQKLHRSYFSFLLFLPLLVNAKGTLEVYWVDVEGGAATLVITPAGESLLVDTGNPGTRDAERIHHIATKVAGLRKIDHLITTHFHGDHYGGAAMLANLMPIGVVNDNGIPKKNPDRHRKNPIFPQLVKPYRDMKVDSRNIVEPGYVFPLKQAKGSAKVKVTCVVANQKVIQPPPNVRLAKNPLTGTVPGKPEDLSDNANSVATLFELGDFRFLDSGDLTWNVEAKLVTPFNVIGKIDVYQVNHHGLDSSNNPVMINSLAPTVSVMNNGHTKGCNAGSFAALKSSKSIQAMWQVHKNLRKDSANNTSDKFIANLTERDGCKGHYLKLSVAENGKSYTIYNPRNDRKVTYKTKNK
jgi:competence protein ComEC